MKRWLLCLVCVVHLISACTPAGTGAPLSTEPAGAKDAYPSAAAAEPTAEQTAAPASAYPATEPAPSPEAAPASPQKGGKIVRAISTEPSTLDPNGGAASGQNVLLPYLLDTLVYRDLDNSYKPYLAESWKVAPNGMTYIFNLKPGILFHDGTPLNAAAVVFTYTRAVQEGSKSALVSALSSVEKIEAVSDTQVVFTLKRPSTTLLSALSNAYAGIISPAAVEKLGDKFGLSPVGSGPFMMKEWKPGETITLARFDSYAWPPAVVKNTGAPLIDELVFKIVPDATAVLTGFQAGEIDMLFVNQPAQFKALGKDKNATLVEANLHSLIYLGFNVAKPPFDNVDVRNAIAAAINKEEIVKLAVGGKGTAAFSPLPPTLPGFDASLADLAPKFDLTTAAELLKKAGYEQQADQSWKNTASGEMLILEILTSTRPPNETIATIVQDQLSKLGVAVTIKALDSNAVTELGNKGDYKVMLWRYDWNDPDVLNMYLSSSRIGKTNRSNYSNPAVDELLSKAGATMDEGKRNGLYVDAQKLIIADQPWVPLYSPIDTIAIRSTIKDVVIGPMGRVLLNDAWVGPKE
ncbi:MAG TPA: ABC transporter substrate-binding protein [Bellilinea sp.]|nr:ABC transporter substrate-binding protein [Bellilinea sp.]